MSDVKWTRDQLRAITARDSSLLVSAAAGSGKTAVLVERLLRRITDEGRDITEFLIITYTKAAASELRRKIYDSLSKYSALHPGIKHIRRQTALVGSARISTVHSFCTWVLRNFSDSSELSGGFRVLDENEARLILEGELSELIEEKYDSGEKNYLARAAYLSGARSDKALFSSVLELYDKSVSHPYPEKWLRDVSDAYDMSNLKSIRETAWGEYAFTAAKDALAGCIQILSCMLDDVEKSTEAGNVYAEFIADEIDMLRRADADDWDGLRNGLLGISFPRLPSSKKIEDKSIPERIRAMHDRVKRECGEITEKFLTDTSATHLGEIGALFPHLCELCALAGELATRFGLEKLRLGVLDYSDLEHYAINLLVESYDAECDEVVPSAAAYEVSKNFCEILLDEFQDSNNIQDIIFRACSRDEKNIVMVGDVKQSIYRFRLADPTIFMKKYKSFKKYEDATGDEARYITLSQNFRSRTEVLDASNALFSRVMTEKLGDVDYTEEHFLVPRENIPKPGRGDKSCEFYLIDRKESELTSAEDEARFIAAKIVSLIDSGFEISDKDGSLRRAEYRDFTILLRSVTGTAEVYERALRDAGIPYASPRAEGLLTKSEVNAIVSYLSVIDNPTSDIPLLAVLKSPLFAFSADDLCCIRRAGNDALIYAMEAIAKENGEIAEKCRAFLSELSLLRSLSRGASAASLIWEIYNRTNALGIFGALTCGEERQRNLIEFYKSAGAFESSGYFGLYRFISHIARLSERGGDIPAPAASEGNAVTIMTIHKSKGLEFPIVFLGGCIRNFNTEDIRRPVLIHPELGVGLRYRDTFSGADYSTVARDVISNAITSEMKSEEMRILYV
ncbi:MAG: helicase-exonuclease AddAB subunit AddA, partial [Oscillospiraceae bacterium]|nr:helicase-exonuclease AddAB subunit AddA [Oscillospiraceae bacterium]